MPGGPKPEWLALSEQAQTARDAGRLDEAADLYVRAQKLGPREVIPNRGACEVELMLEAKGNTKLSSRGSCYRAFLLGASAQDMRNDVASALSPRQHPSLDDLATASLMSEAAKRKASNEPWGYLARCDIARRLGSADVLEACLADLKQLVPDHAATKAALAAPAERVSFGRWAGRALFLLLVIGTPAHALARRWRQRQRRSPIAAARTAALFVAVCTLLLARGLLAAPAPSKEAPAAHDKVNAHLKPVEKEHLSSFKIDDADPEASVPSPEAQQKGPLQFGYFIQDLATRTELAIKRGDHAAAARYLKALSKATPRAAYGPRKLCEQLEAAGDIATAIKACRSALLREGSTVGDYSRFVHVVLATREKLPDLERKELEMVIAHLAQEPNVGTLPATLRCQVALRFEDTKALTACTQELEKAASKDPQTVSFAWALAVQKKDKSAALKLIDRGRELGMSDDSLAMMAQATDKMERRKLTRNILLAAGVALLLALAGIGARRLASRRRAAGSGPGASALPVS